MATPTSLTTINHLRICRTRFVNMNILYIPLLFTLWITRTFSLKFSVSGYEACIFHLVDSAAGLSRPTIDLIEDILTKSQGGQQWTLSRLPGVRPGYNERTLNGTEYFQELCSVNVLVQTEGCFERRQLIYIFNDRPLELQSLFIIILGNSLCEQNRLGTFGLIRTDLFRFYVIPNTSTLESGDFLCPICPASTRIWYIHINND